MRQVKTFYFYTSGEDAGAGAGAGATASELRISRVVARAFRQRMRPGQRARTRYTSFKTRIVCFDLISPNIPLQFTVYEKYWDSTRSITEIGQ
jgi:hypothetical protein